MTIPNLEERTIILTAEQYAIVRATELELQEALRRQQLVHQTILAQVSVGAAQVLRVDALADGTIALVYLPATNGKVKAGEV